jgi:hypothetical protein
MPTIDIYGGWYGEEPQLAETIVGESFGDLMLDISNEYNLWEFFAEGDDNYDGYVEGDRYDLYDENNEYVWRIILRRS